MQDLYHQPYHKGASRVANSSIEVLESVVYGLRQGGYADSSIQNKRGGCRVYDNITQDSITHSMIRGLSGDVMAISSHSHRIPQSQVQDLKVCDLGSGVWGLGFRVQSLGLRV